MCHYCYLKKIKKRARENNQKVVITMASGGYEVRVHPRNWKPSDVEEDSGFDVHLIFYQKPDRCRCEND